MTTNDNRNTMDWNNLITEEEYQAGQDTWLLKVNIDTGETKKIHGKRIKDQVYFKDDNGDIVAPIRISFEELMTGKDLRTEEAQTKAELEDLLNDNDIQL